MNKKEVVEFGEKYLMKSDENRTEEPKAWIDNNKSLMLKSNKSEIINILNNYQDLKTEKYDDACNKIRNIITAKSVFDINYIKDILKLMTKIKSDAKRVIIEAGNNSPIILKLVDNKDEIIEIVLAPIDEYSI